MVSGGCIVGIGLYLDGVCGCLQCLDVSKGLSGCATAHPLQSGEFTPI